MRQLLVLGSLVGLAYAGLETAAASAGGSVHPVPQLAVHLVLAVLATALAALLLGAAGVARERRAALGAAVAAGSLVAASLLLRAHFAYFASQRWTSPDHAMALGASIAAGAALAWGLFRGFTRARGKWIDSKPAAAGAAMLLVVASPLAVRALDGWAEPELGAAGTACDAPYDVLVITLDTLRRDHLTHYGYPRPTSRALEPFGFTRFDHGYAVSSWTRPATASLLTGLYPSKHTAVERSSKLPASARTLAELLAARGFATGFCAGTLNASGVFGMDQGAQFTTGDPDRPEHVLAGTALGEVLRRRGICLQDARDLNRFALAFLREARGRRFFLYVHYDDPHKPYAPPAELLRRYTQPFDGRVLVQPSQGPMTPAEVEHMLARYDGDVENAVRAAARLLEELARQGRLDTTLVVFTADHGEAFGEHGRWNHSNSVYDELVAIPLLVRPPAALGGVGVVSEPASQVDIVPTVLDYLGIESPAGLDGRSLRPWIEGAAGGEARVLLSECARTDQWSCRDERYKLIAGEAPGDEALELYDVATDPLELSNLAGSEELRPVRERLLAEGLQARAKLREGSLPPEERSLSGQLWQRLSALGYVE